MQESLMSLMQMAKTSAVLAKMAQAHLPFISVMADPTMGGVSASLAMLGDVNIAEPNALIGFAGPRVIEQTVREKLPEGFQHAEFLLEKGAIDMILTRHQMRDQIAEIIAKLLGYELKSGSYVKMGVTAEAPEKAPVKKTRAAKHDKAESAVSAETASVEDAAEVLGAEDKEAAPKPTRKRATKTAAEPAEQTEAEPVNEPSSEDAAESTAEGDEGEKKAPRKRKTAAAAKTEAKD